MRDRGEHGEHQFAGRQCGVDVLFEADQVDFLRLQRLDGHEEFPERAPEAVEPVTEAADRRRREAMVETHHPEGWRRPPGGQVRYWVRSERHGVLGGIGFAASGIQLGPRDGFIGWSADARVTNIGKVVCNNRFLLLSGVRVKGLASRVLRLATARVADDWAAACGERPAPAFLQPSASAKGVEVHAGRREPAIRTVTGA